MNVMKNRKGMTGLETAIILIAFVITAAAFSFVVLNMGFLSAQKTQTVISSGMKEAASSIQADGDVVGTFDTASTPPELLSVQFYVRLSQGKEPIDTVADKLVATYTTATEHEELAVVDAVGEGIYLAPCEGMTDTDALIEAGERWSVIVTFPAANDPIEAYDVFRIELRPSTGSVLIIERNVPAINNAIQVLE